MRGPDGRHWSVKLGPEAQTEVVVSRILWAIGYHQLPTYYLPSWTMAGTQSGPQQGGRFRPDLADRKVVDAWAWYENEFIATQPFKGLIVANVLLNNWDWKTSNNRIYDVEAADGPGTATSASSSATSALRSAAPRCPRCSVLSGSRL